MTTPTHNKLYALSVVAAMAVATLFSSCAESFEDRCRREARDFTVKQCPRQLDGCTRLDSMVFQDEPVGFNYYYSVSGNLDTDSVFADAERNETFRQGLVQNVRSDIALRQCKEHHFTFTYIYFSAGDGHVLTQYAITPDEY